MAVSTATYARRWYILGASCFALFMAILDNLVVNIALPTISQELEASTTQLQWIVSAYTLVFASLQITAGGLGDRFGRKRWFILGTALFTATSLVAAFSTSIEMLIVMRALQGLGAALIMPLSLSLISDAFPPEERGKALGIWSAVSVSGLAAGPIVGGVLVEYGDWGWVFLVNVPIGIAALIVTALVVHESRDTSGEASTDVLGTALVTAAIGVLTWGLIEAGERGWSDGAILAALGAALVFGALFVWVESRVERPMVPLSFFRSRTFTGANAVSFAFSFAIIAFAFFWTLYLQNIHGYSAVRTGLTLLPMVIVMMVCSPLSGVLLSRIGASRQMLVGTLISTGGMLLFLRSGVEATYLDVLPALLVMGFGNSLIFAPMTTAVLNSVDTAKAGVASAVNGAVREVGAAFSIAFLGTIMNQAYQSSYNSSDAIEGLRADPAMAQIQPLLDLVGTGVGFAGRVVQDASVFPGFTAEVALLVRDASADAFMVGMDRGIIIGAMTMLVAAVLSFFLVDDRVVRGDAGPQAALSDVEAGEGVPAEALSSIQAGDDG
jgi:EmrB/QacA subfamily drug resistance transporter